MIDSRRQLWVWVCSFLLLTGLLLYCCGHNAAEESEGLRHFFEKLDDNHDGQVDEREAKKFIGESIGGSEFDSGEELTEAFQTMVHNMDQDHEKRKTISEAEVQQHLHSLDQAVSVKEWVHHGLGLPQYAQAFKDNMITADDFPLLVNDDGLVLKEELQISSRLHRNQIIRGMQRLILGLGELPSSPRNLKCVDYSKTHALLQWELPVGTGNPPIHKFVIESDALWNLISEIEAKVGTKHYSHSIPHTTEAVSYEITSWNAYGPSTQLAFPPCSQQPSSTPLPPQIQVKEANEGEDVEKRSIFSGIWTFVVIGLTVGLRVLTRNRIRLIICCCLFKLTKVARWMQWESMVRRLDTIERTDCEHCLKLRKASEKEISLTKAQSQKISRMQHFPVDPSHLANSASSPALGRASPVDAVGEVVKLHKLDSAPKQSSESLGSSNSNSLELEDEAPNGLIVGRCGHKGCVREWCGAFQLRNRWSRHFCCFCLQTYCYEHTAISPHGTFGYCGQHSQCWCLLCFQKQPLEKQNRLKDINKLDRKNFKKAELERGCTLKEVRKTVKSFLNVKKITGFGSRKKADTEDNDPESDGKKYISRDSQTDLMLLDTPTSD